MADAFPTSNPSPVLPFDRAYWVLPGRLLAGHVPVKPNSAGTRRQLRALLSQGIRTFVNLMHGDEQNYTGQVISGYEQELAEEAAALGVAATTHRLSIVDLDVPTVAHMQHVLDVVDAALAAGRPTYVHCWGGRGRTGTVWAAFWPATATPPGSVRSTSCSTCAAPMPKATRSRPKRRLSVSLCASSP